MSAPRRPTRAERLYGLLLHAYPSAFRAVYEHEMTLLFRDQCREANAGTLRFWTAVLCDVAQSAPALRVEAWRARGDENTRTLGAIMKITAIYRNVNGRSEMVARVAEATKSRTDSNSRN